MDIRTYDGSGDMTDENMIRQIWDEVRYVRERLDKHITDEGSSLSEIRKQLAEQQATSRIINGGITLFIAAAFTWLFNFIGLGRP